MKGSGIMWVVLSEGRIGPPILGVIVPAVILGLSFFLTYLLVKHFSKH
ncbi:MAG: hypothetical protein V3U24_04325 [Candidatus Neomarinimicrobiota bacterium]